MTRLLDRIYRTEERQANLDELLQFYNVGGNPYALNQTYPSGDREYPQYDSYRNATTFKTNGIVFACMAARLALFTEARFLWRRYKNGRPGDLFGNQDLTLLENPDVNLTTGGLLARMEQDASLTGNSYHARVEGPNGDRLVRLRPENVTIIMASPNRVENIEQDPEARVIGYMYSYQGGSDEGRIFTPDQVAHFAPTPDPLANFRGMSWLTPILREIDADDQANTFKANYWNHAATPNMVVTVDKEVGIEKFQQFKKLFDEEHMGAVNAFKTLFLGGGAAASSVGNSLQQAEFKAVQGAGETRIAAAAGVPPVIVGLSEGLAASTYSNYAQARRRFADGTARPWWREAAASLDSVVPRTSTSVGAHLWYDDRDIAFLRDDARDVAEIAQLEALTLKTFVEAGADWDSAIGAIQAGDLSRLLGQQAGISVQLRPQGIAEVTSTIAPQNVPDVVAAGGKVDNSKTPPTPPVKNGKTPPA